MCDGFLTLARTEKGVTVLLPVALAARWQPQSLFIQRLKDKLGNRSNASSEIEYSGTRAIQVGEEGRGIPTLIEMAHLTRLETAISSAAIIRRGLTEAIQHTRTRHLSTGLIDQPIMEAVIADLRSRARLISRWRCARRKRLT